MTRWSNFWAICTLALLSAGCRDSAYSAASKADTVEAYQRYLRQHPLDENAELAKARVLELELERAKAIHTVLGYKRFLDQYGHEPKAAPARALLEGLRYNAAAEKGTAVAWRQFLNEHPDGARREQAEAELAKAELKEVGDLADGAELQRYVAAYGEDERGSQATARIDERAFATANSAAALYAYLRDQPAGAHRDEARARLLSLQLEGLLVSGRLAEARAIAAKAPLAKELKGLDDRFRRAAELEGALRSREAAVQRALPSYYLRTLDDLLKSLSAPDPMDRWQAAEELGALVDVKAIDPLLEAVRASRHTLVRQRAFDSLGRVLAALPKEVAEYEVATRVEQALANASDESNVLATAALIDVGGQLDKAAPLYQRAFDPQAPDPLVLVRWSTVRAMRGQHFSAAVAARQLALWAERQVLAETEGGALGRARELCATAEAAAFAAGVITRSRAESTEFPDDVRQFELKAQAVVKLTAAKLRDAELKLLEADASARRCGDDAVAQRLADAEKRRLEAVAQLKAKAPRVARVVLALAMTRDPSMSVRRAAEAAGSSR